MCSFDPWAMDIRRYLKRQRTDNDPSTSSPDESDIFSTPDVDASGICAQQATSLEFSGPSSVTTSGICDVGDRASPSCSSISSQDLHSLDVGTFLDPNKLSLASDLQNWRLITDPWIPTASHDYKKDAAPGQRTFRHEWLKDYSSWLAYSSIAKGVVRRHCVVFRPNVRRGKQGVFIVCSFTNYRKMHEACREHVSSQWHKESVGMSQCFVNVMEKKQLPVVHQVSSALHVQVDQNREKISSIVSTIAFCATHDIPLRGKHSNTGVFSDLLDFRVDAGDKVLEEHFLKLCGKCKVHFTKGSE